ncbi:MAG: hypothetical protein ABIJ82_03410 [Patescibacteria group bacterium]|nr:hypothetical protein [Patescibacteria group bacterium]MBU1953139.1 hypothetical protein [Patescibacteria group bacterium]
MPDEATVNPISDDQQAVNPVVPNLQTTPQSEPIVDIEEKEKEIKRKKRKFIATVVIGGLCCLIFILIPVGIKIYKTYFLKTKPIVQEINEENKTPQIPTVIDVSKLVQLNSDLLKISLEYLQQANVAESYDEANQIKKLEIAFDKQDGQEKITEENLKEGYIFRVSAFTTSQRTLQEATQVKKGAFTTKCPDTAIFSGTEGITINSIDGFTFDIQNCGADYKLAYILKSGVIYEFAQIYKGDVGYRQVYKAATDNILLSVKFYPDKVDTGPLETFTSPDRDFSFKYPKTFKADCCDTPALVSGKAALITLGDPKTLVDRNNFDGFAVLMDRYSEGGTDAYLNKQRKTLIDDYIVVKGEAPTLRETSIKVGNKDALLLKGYTWNGNSLIYVPIISDYNSGKVLIISIKNISGDSFDLKMNEILKSFEFVEKSTN